MRFLMTTIDGRPKPETRVYFWSAGAGKVFQSVQDSNTYMQLGILFHFIKLPDLVMVFFVW